MLLETGTIKFDLKLDQVIEAAALHEVVSTQASTTMLLYLTLFAFAKASWEHVPVYNAARIG